MPTTTNELHTTLLAIQNIADRLALGVTFSLTLGSASMGNSYKLHTARAGAPEDSRPIGRTRTEAQQSLRSMIVAFDIVRRSQLRIAEESITLTEAVARPDYSIKGTFADPDARSVRRAGERG